MHLPARSPLIRRPSRSRHVAFFAALVVSSVTLSAQVWTNATSGAWTTAGNWTGGVPGSGDITLVLAAGTPYTITLSSALGETGTLSIDSPDATLLLSGSTLNLDANLGASTFTFGTVQLTGGSFINGTSSSFGNTLTNLASITSTSGSNGIYSTGSAGNGLTFTNSGTVTATGGSLLLGSGLGDSVINSGTIEANGTGATVKLYGGTEAIANTGTLEATNGGTIDLGGLILGLALTGTIEIVGSGTISIS
jgi:hypothetical protein